MPITDGTKKFLADVAERAARTFGQGFVAFWMLQGFDADELLVWANVKVGLAAGGLSVLMSAFGATRGKDDSGSLLPAQLDP